MRVPDNAAPGKVKVVLEGESSTGKTLVATEGTVVLEGGKPVSR